MVILRLLVPSVLLTLILPCILVVGLVVAVGYAIGLATLALGGSSQR